MEERKIENIPAPHHVSMAVLPSPEQEEEPGGGNLRKLISRGCIRQVGLGPGSCPEKFKQNPPSFLFFLAMSTSTAWDFEPLWEQARYFCPTKTSRFAFVSAGQYFPARV